VVQVQVDRVQLQRLVPWRPYLALLRPAVQIRLERHRPLGI
jgi:hypothetical protein